MHSEEDCRTQVTSKRRQTPAAVTEADAFGHATAPHPRPRVNGSEPLRSVPIRVLVWTYIPKHIYLRLIDSTHSRCRSCISRPTRLMTWGDMFSNDERSDIFLLLMTGKDTRAPCHTSVFWAHPTPAPRTAKPRLARNIRRWVLMM